MNKTLYMYDANTKRAIVYSRNTDAVLCDVTGVDTYIGNLLSRLAEESYAQGRSQGMRDAIESVTSHLDNIATTV